MNELVILQDKQAVTTSIKIAEVFGKEHKTVIRAIEEKIQSAQNYADYNSMFYESTYKDSKNREQKQYLLNRDGFTFIAFGFTGKKADQFKLDFIKAFNQMEYQLKNSIPTNMVEALTLALEQAKTIEVQKQVIGELKPKADYVDKILKSKSLVTITQIAKDYGMSGQTLNKKLHELGVQYKQSDQWLLYMKHHAKGYTSSETIDLSEVNGVEKVVMNTKWTQKGRLFLYELLKENGILPTIEMN